MLNNGEEPMKRLTPLDRQNPDYLERVNDEVEWVVNHHTAHCFLLRQTIFLLLSLNRGSFPAENRIVLTVLY